VAAVTVVVLALLAARFQPGDPAQVPVPGTFPDANGVAELPPGEILEAARSALVGARSVRLRGDFNDQGRPLRLDVRLLAGGGATGWVQSDGRRFRLINTGGHTYLRGRQAIERWGSPSAADYVGDRGVLVPSGTGTRADFPGAVDLVRFADSALGPGASAGFVTGPSETIAGRPAVRLDGTQGSWWVALTGPPYPLRLEYRLAVDGPVQHLDLSDYDREISVKARPTRST
jgi:hypothetical protein